MLIRATTPDKEEYLIQKETLLHGHVGIFFVWKEVMLNVNVTELSLGWKNKKKNQLQTNDVQSKNRLCTLNPHERSANLQSD